MTSPTPQQSQVGGLLPCPFCGGGATFVKHSAGVMRTQGFDQWDAVACRSCGATVGACDRRFRNREDAAKAWNARHAQAAAPGVQGWLPIETAPKDSIVILCSVYGGVRTGVPDEGSAYWMPLPASPSLPSQEGQHG